MSPLLLVAIVVALLGFVLLLKPELLWKRFQKNADASLPNTLAAFLRLVGIGVLALSVVVANLVQ